MTIIHAQCLRKYKSEVKIFVFALCEETGPPPQGTHLDMGRTLTLPLTQLLITLENKHLFMLIS